MAVTGDGLEEEHLKEDRLNQRINKRGLRAMSSVIIVALLYLAYFGEKTAIEAIRLLQAGKETGPLGDLYPGWSLWHFLSAIIFLTLVLFQLVPRIRMRFPVVHRVIGRIAILAALVAAVSAVAIATVAQGRPLFWRFWVGLQFVLISLMLLRGFVAARKRQFAQHQAWMIRSIAFALAVLTQRLVFPIFPALLAIHSDERFWKEFTCAAILATGINLVIAECWLRIGKLIGRLPPFPAEAVGSVR